MKTMAITQFKPHIPQILAEVNETREPVLITKRGKPLAQINPVADDKPVSGRLRGMISHMGDIISPIDVEWDACK